MNPFLTWICTVALACAPVSAFSGNRSIGNNNAASNATEVVCVDAITGVPTSCGPSTVTGSVILAPTGQSQYGLTLSAGTTDGTTAITGYAVCSIFKTAAGSLYNIRGRSAGVYTLQLYDSASIPADGTLTWKSSGGVLVDSIDIPAAGNWSVNYTGPYGLAFTAGITACYSTTPGMVKTQVGAAGANSLLAAVQP